MIVELAVVEKGSDFLRDLFNVLLGAVLSPVLSTIGGLVVPEMEITFNQFALLSGWPLLTSGCAAWIAPVKYGGKDQHTSSLLFCFWLPQSGTRDLQHTKASWHVVSWKVLGMGHMSRLSLHL
jgi:hypothetical protein